MKEKHNWPRELRWNVRVKSRTPTEGFSLLDLPTFSTMHHLSCSVAHGMLPSPSQSPTKAAIFVCSPKTVKSTAEVGYT